jgi:hypothetical protein
LKTVEEIVKHLETELEKAQMTYELLKTEDKQRAVIYIAKVATITELLEEIKR